MGFRVVHKNNAPWPPNTWFDCDDGWCQEIVPHTDRGKVVSFHTKGLMIPMEQVAPWTVGIIKRGLEVGGYRRG